MEDWIPTLQRFVAAGLALFAPLLLSEPFRELEAGLEAGTRGRALTGLVTGARALIVTLLATTTRRARRSPAR